MPLLKPLLKTLLLTLLVSTLPAHANPLQELRDTLTKLSGNAALKATVQVKSEGRSQDGDETESNTAQASVQLEDGPQGLRLTYPNALLAKASQEEAAKAANPKAGTPTASGLRSLSYTELRDLARAADNLRRDLANASFKSERQENWQGQPARLLSFEVAQAKKDKYVKKFERTLEVWLAADGTPLASRDRQRVAGSAYVVISFEFENSEELSFGVVGDRLVTTRRVTTNSGSGAGQKGSGRAEYQLQIS